MSVSFLQIEKWNLQKSIYWTDQTFILVIMFDRYSIIILLKWLKGEASTTLIS